MATNARDHGMKLRLLTKDDADLYFALRLRALKEEPEAFGGSYEETKVMNRDEIESRLECSDNAFVYGAFDPRLVGMIGFFRRKGIKARHKGCVWGMYTVSEARGRGIGRALMDALIVRAKQLPDIEEILLSVVTSNNAALQFYESVGFEQYGIEKGALKLDGKYLDEILMNLKLS